MTDQTTAFIAAFVTLFTDLRAKAVESNTDRCIASWRCDEINYAFDLAPHNTFQNTALVRDLRSELLQVLVSDLTIEGLKALHAEFLKLFWLRGGSENDLKKEFNEFMHLV